MRLISVAILLASRILVALACAGLSAMPIAQDRRSILPADRVAVLDMSTVPSIELAPGVRVRTVVGSQASFSVGEFDSGAATVLHHHTREQASIGLTGMLDMTLGTHVEALGPGSGVIVPPDVAHSIANRRAGVSTGIEFHTVRRLDLVPPRPALTFPAAPEPVRVPDDRALMVRLDEHGEESSTGQKTIRGETSTLTWRRLLRGTAPASLLSGRTELFVYVVQGTAELSSAGSVQRLTAGTLLIIPGGAQRATIRAVDTTAVALVEFSPERR